MAITIHKPNDPVTGFSLSAIAGNMPADTYKIRLEVLGTNTASTFDYGAQQRSAPCTEQTIVLGATGGIRLSWTNPTDGLNKNTLIFIYSQLANRWYWYNGVILDPALTTYDMVDYSVYRHKGTNWLKDSTSPTPAFPCGLDAEIGQGMIEITGDAGSITPADLINALKTAYGGSLPANAYYNDCRTFWGYWSIKATGATSGTLDLSNWELWMFGGIENGAGLLLSAVSSRIQQTILYSPAQEGAARYYCFGNCDLNSINFGEGNAGMDNTYYSGVQMVTSSASKFKDSILGVIYPSLAYYDTFDNCNIICSHLLLRQSAITAPVLKATLLGGFIRYTYRYGDKSIQLLNWRVDSSTYQIDFGSDRTGYSCSLYFIDPVFPNTPSGYSYIPVIYWRSTSTAEPNPVYIQSEVDLKVVDANNNPIENASVVLKDKDDTEVINENTDINGKTTKAYISHHSVSHIVGSGDGYVGTNQINDLNPFTMEIKKAGYQTYKAIFTLDKALDWTIRLKRSSINIDQEVIC